MASKPKLSSGSAAQKRPAPVRDAPTETRPERAGATREAVREIVRRYRETFERLGR
jgi:hypothetical protein